METRRRHGDIVDALGSSIVWRRLLPGETFTTADVEREHGVSKSVAREALRVVESLRLISSSPRVGCTVLPESEWSQLAPDVVRWRIAGPDRLIELQALTELRLGIEPEAAALAALRADWTHAAVLREAAERMAELGREGKGDSAEFLDEDVRFHTTILEATGNPAYSVLAETVAACLRGRTAAALTPKDPDELNLDAHIELAAAIAERNPARARHLSRSLVDVVLGEVS